MIYHSNHNRVGFEKPARGTRIPAPSSYSMLAFWKRETDLAMVTLYLTVRITEFCRESTYSLCVIGSKPRSLSHTQYPL